MLTSPGVPRIVVAMLRRSAIVLMAAVLCVLIPSCTVRQQVTLHADGSGTAVVEVRMREFFASYLLDLAEFTGTEVNRELGVFDPDEIRAAVEGKDGVEVLSIERVSAFELRMEIGFDSVADLVASEELLTETGILTLTSSGDSTQFRAHFDKTNYLQISALFPMVDQTLLQMFGPQEGISIAEDEYLEMMSFALGEEGPPAIKESLLETVVTVPGTVVSQSGGATVGSTVTFPYR